MRLERNIMQFDSNEDIQSFDPTVNFMLANIKNFRMWWQILLAMLTAMCKCLIQVHFLRNWKANI